MEKRTHSAAHHSLATIKRSQGQSATARIAYIAGLDMRDERTGTRHRFRKRKDVVHTCVVGCTLDPGTLANAMEAAEKRKDGQVGRSTIAALPADIDDDARIRIATNFAQALNDRYRCACVVAIHAPHRPRKEHADEGKNWHAHVVETSRRVVDDTLTEKITELSKKSQSSIEVEWRRQTWADLCNGELARAQSEDGTMRARVDHRSFERRKASGDLPAEALPGRHLGPAAAALARADDREHEIAEHAALALPADETPATVDIAGEDRFVARIEAAEAKAEVNRLAALVARLERLVAKARDLKLRAARRARDRAHALAEAALAAFASDGTVAPQDPLARFATLHPATFLVTASENDDSDALRARLATMPNLELREAYTTTRDAVGLLEGDTDLSDATRGVAVLEVEARDRGFDLETGRHVPETARDPDRARLHTDQWHPWKPIVRKRDEHQITR